MKSSKNWRPEEDRALIELYVTRGLQSWSRINKILSLQFKILNKTPKICRERYINHLDPSVNRQQWTHSEETALMELHSKLGNRWAQISRRLPGRTDNSVKNKFYSKYRRAIKNINLLLEHFRCFKLKQLKITFVYKVINFLEGKDSLRPAHDAALVQNALFSYTVIKNEIITFEQMDFNRIENQQDFKNKLEELVRRIQGFNLNLKRKPIKKKMAKNSKSEELPQSFQAQPLHVERHQSCNANTAVETPCKNQCQSEPIIAFPNHPLLPSPGKPPETEYLWHLFTGMCVENEDNFWNLADGEAVYCLQSQ